ncbi:MAG: hypothetical protein AAFV85_23265 [Cyanobacteria bacterium J06634_6]
MTKNTNGAIYIAPLTSVTEIPSGVQTACELERVGLSLENANGQEKYLEVWVEPNSLAAVIKAKRGLCPGNWFIVETMADEQLPKFVDVNGNAWLEL